MRRGGQGFDSPAVHQRLLARSPAWSPDDTRIACHSGDPEAGLSSFTIWLMKADGSGKVRLTKGAVHGVWPQWSQWSPDGKQIVFTRAWPGSDRAAVFVMNADGGGLKRETKGGNVGYCAVSPDGKRIAISADP